MHCARIDTSNIFIVYFLCLGAMQAHIIELYTENNCQVLVVVCRNCCRTVTRCRPWRHNRCNNAGCRHRPHASVRKLVFS